MRRIRKPDHVRNYAIHLYLTTEMSAQEVADEVGVHRRTIHRWVNDDGGQPEIGDQEKLADLKRRELSLPA